MPPDRHQMIEMHRSQNATTGANIAAGQHAVTDGSGGFVYEDAGSSGGSGFDVTPPLSNALPPWVKPTGTGVITADPQGRINLDTGANYKGFPSMAFLEGRLHLVYRDGTAHTSSDAVAKYRTSDDLGRTWSSASTIVTPTAGDQVADVYVTALSSGRLVVAYNYRTPWNGASINARVIYSDNRGQSWSSAYVVPDTIGTNEADVSGQIVELGDGTLLMPGYGDVGGLYRTWVWTSTDGGETWPTQTNVASDGTASLNEMTIRRLASGRIVALIRDETSSDTYRSVSTDNGATWSAEAMVIDNNSPGRPDFVEIWPSALLWFGRGTSLASRWAVSWDEGATWTAVQETDSGETLNAEYHAPVVLAPGYVIIVYAIENTSSDTDLYIRYYFDGYGTDPLGQIRAKWLQVDEQTAPSTPPSGKGVFYAKSDSLPYFKNDGGTEYDLTSGSPSGAAGGDLSGTYPNPSVVDDSHSHTSATAPGGGAPPAILLESGHAVPFTFDEILQESDGSDFLWASE